MVIEAMVMDTGKGIISKMIELADTTLIIAEIGQAHDGSLGILHSYIDALADTGVDILKFQTHIAAAESSNAEPFRVKFSYQDVNRFDYWKRMEFNPAQWKEIKEHCEQKGLEFMSSPFSQAAVDLLEELAVKRFKIGSGEVNNYLLLEKIGLTGKPVILSSGMSSFAELDEAVAFLQPFGNPLTILQCTTSYPTPPERIGFNVMAELKNRYPGIKVGLSEHTGKTATGLAAVALGAEVLEFHAVFDRRMFGPDAGSSLTINEIRELVEGIRFLETALRNPVNKQDNTAFAELKNIFGKSLAVNKDLPAGHLLRFEDLEAKKPSGQGIPASSFKHVIGRALKIPKSRYDFLTWHDVEA